MRVDNLIHLDDSMGEEEVFSEDKEVQDVMMNNNFIDDNRFSLSFVSFNIFLKILNKCGFWHFSRAKSAQLLRRPVQWCRLLLSNIKIGTQNFNPYRTSLKLPWTALN